MSRYVRNEPLHARAAAKAIARRVYKATMDEHWRVLHAGRREAVRVRQASIDMAIRIYNDARGAK